VFLALDAFGAQPSYRTNSEYLTPGSAKLFLNYGAHGQCDSVQVTSHSLFSTTPIAPLELDRGRVNVALMGDN